MHAFAVLVAAMAMGQVDPIFDVAALLKPPLEAKMLKTTEKDGLVTEGASSTFFAVREGRLITHPCDRGILPGTIRDHVISIALNEKIRVDERPVTENELYSLDEAFLTSTTQSVMPITEIDGRIVGNSRRGPVTERLQTLFDDFEKTLT